MPKPHPAIVKILGDLHLNKVDRAKAVKLIAGALDAITPFALIPGIGPLIEAATDAIWTPAAEAIVDGFEKARKKAIEKAAAKRKS